MTQIWKVLSLIWSHNIHFFFSSYEHQDFLEDPCLTPDCVGRVVNIQLFDTQGLKIEVKQFCERYSCSFSCFCLVNWKSIQLSHQIQFAGYNIFFSSSSSSYFCFSLNTKGSMPNQNPNPKLPSKIKWKQGLSILVFKTVIVYVSIGLDISSSF